MTERERNVFFYYVNFYLKMSNTQMVLQMIQWAQYNGSIWLISWDKTHIYTHATNLPQIEMDSLFCNLYLFREREKKTLISGLI